MIELRAGSAVYTISPTDGGRIATLQVDGTDLIVGPDPALPAAGWGIYPMVPYAGRIRNGRFRFDGVDYQMPTNFAPHAIHGTGFEQSWDAAPVTTGRDTSSVALSCRLDWELGGESQHVIDLAASSLTCTLTARAGDRPMPCTLGWHPWFIKPQRVDLSFETMYLRDDDYITDGRSVSPPPPPPWDDCFTGPLRTPRLWISTVEVSISSDCDYWVVYDMPTHATCVEPQTGLPDAFNLSASVGGATRLDPGEELRRTMTIAWA
ncbi:MAG: aldose epimerase family protein [Ilumatobacteraceae bacterium]